MQNVCYRGCRQLFPGTKILKNDLLTAEKINFEVGSKIFSEKKNGPKNSDFFNENLMKNENLKKPENQFSLIFH